MAPRSQSSTAVVPGGGITASTRRQLTDLHRAHPGPFTVAEASDTLRLPSDETRRLLGYLARKGWLRRVRRGLYLPVPLEAEPGQWSDDPWIVADKAFGPCYIGGWSAAEHWGLTEQVFRDVVVVSARETRGRLHVLQETRYLVTRRDPTMFEFGLRSVWRGQTRVRVSDPARTIVDMLDDPSLGGGIRHVAAMLDEYLAGDSYDDDVLVTYADRLGNGAVFKRLGWLLELHGAPEPLLDACRERRTAGLVKLDPTVAAAGHIVRRWRLRVNVDLTERRDAW